MRQSGLLSKLPASKQDQVNERPASSRKTGLERIQILDPSLETVLLSVITLRRFLLSYGLRCYRYHIQEETDYCGLARYL